MALARCAWEVTAGMIPGQPELEHTKVWGLSSEEWDGGRGYALFLEREAQATAYARYLQELCAGGRTCNWTRVDFIWF